MPGTVADLESMTVSIEQIRYKIVNCMNKRIESALLLILFLFCPWVIRKKFFYLYYNAFIKKTQKKEEILWKK